MSLHHYNYVLPPELIAQEPLPRRSDARMLVVNRSTQSFHHRHVRDLPEFLRPRDCLVVNNTRVVSARLSGKRTRTGGKWEGLFLQTVPPNMWHMMGKTRGKMHTGETIQLRAPDGNNDMLIKEMLIELKVKNEDNTWLVSPYFPVHFFDDKEIDGKKNNGQTFEEKTFALLEQLGSTPIPPYIRGGRSLPYDKERYQTIYAAQWGSAAAPTAGLHLTPDIIESAKQKGVTLTPVTLHVGLGTFKPITAENIEEHDMHAEWCTLSEETAKTLWQCRSNGGRIVAVGTTSIRTLESASAGNGAKTMMPFSGATSLFIRPPYSFRNVDALLTNFHFPKSTLLILVRTFGGDELIREAYLEAIREKYRFFSYGDAMFIF